MTHLLSMIFVLGLLTGCSLTSDLGPYSAPEQPDTTLDLGDLPSDADTTSGDTDVPDTPPDATDDLGPVPDVPEPCEEKWITVIPAEEAASVANLDALVTPDGVLWITYESVVADEPTVSVVRVNGTRVEPLRSANGVMDIYSPALAYVRAELRWHWVTDEVSGGNIHTGSPSAVTDVPLFGSGAGHVVEATPGRWPDREEPLFLWSQQGIGSEPELPRCGDAQANCMIIGNATKWTVIADALAEPPRHLVLSEHGDDTLALWFDLGTGVINLRRVAITDDGNIPGVEPRFLPSHTRAPHPSVLPVNGGWLVAYLSSTETVQTTVVPLEGDAADPVSDFAGYEGQRQPVVAAAFKFPRTLLFATTFELVVAQLDEAGRLVPGTDHPIGPLSNLSQNGLVAVRGAAGRELAVVVASSSGVRAGWLDSDLMLACPPEL